MKFTELRKQPNQKVLLQLVSLIMILAMIFTCTTGFQSLGASDSVGDISVPIASRALQNPPVLTSGHVYVNSTQVANVDVYMDNLPVTGEIACYADVSNILTAISGTISINGNDIEVVANGITIDTSVYDGNESIAAKMWINGNITLNDEPPKIINSTVMFPVAYLFRNLSCNVDVDQNTGDIYITYDPNIDFSFGPEGFGGGTKGAFGCVDGNGDMVEPTVLTVTSLTDDPNNVQSGTLRWAINQTYPRVIRFDVAGTIDLKADLVINTGSNTAQYIDGVSTFTTQSYVTIDGYSAPGEGIALKNASLVIDGYVGDSNLDTYVLGTSYFSRVEEVAIRYIRFRVGDEAIRGSYPTGSGGTDCISIQGYAKNILLDHCSLSWSCDELMGILTGQNVTVQWCIFSEPLGDTDDKYLKTPIANRLHPYGAAHAFNFNSSAVTLSIHHSLFAHGKLRMPQFESNDSHYNQVFDQTEESVNNVIFDFNSNASRYTIGSDVVGGRTDATQIGDTLFQYQYINNYFKNDTTTYPEILAELTSVTSGGVQLTTAQRLTSQTKAYLSGNIGPNRTSLSQDEWDIARIKATAHGVTTPTKIDLVTGSDATALKATRSTTQLFTSTVTTQTAVQAYDLVLKYAGASKRYDAVDKRIINDVITNKYYTSGYFGAAGVFNITFPWSKYVTAQNVYNNLTTTPNNALYINGSGQSPIYPNLQDPTNPNSPSLGAAYKHIGFVTNDFLGDTGTFWTTSGQEGYAFRNHANSTVDSNGFKIVYLSASPKSTICSPIQVGGYPTLQTGSADLDFMIIGGGTLTTTYNPAKLTYVAQVSQGKYDSIRSGGLAPITVQPTSSSSSATITVNGVTVTSGTVKDNITLGSDLKVYIVVTGADAISQTYVISFTNAAPVYLINDGFNSSTTGTVPSGWTANEAGGTARVANVPSTTNKSVFLSDTSTSNPCGLSKTFTAQTGIVVVTMKFMQTTKGNSHKIIRFEQGTTPAVNIESNGGNICYRNSDDTYTSLITNYTANTWYTIKIVANVATQKADVYVDGVLKTSNKSFYSTVTQIDKINTYTTVSGTSDHYVDVFQVYN